MAKRSLQTTQKDVANCDHLPQLSVESRILTIRDVQVILDRDLAELYGVQTARLNEQVKRNARRFPETFRFQLNQQETDELIANCDRFKTLKHSSFCPYAFTEQGVAMLVMWRNCAIFMAKRILFMKRVLLSVLMMSAFCLPSNGQIREIFDNGEIVEYYGGLIFETLGESIYSYRFVYGRYPEDKQALLDFQRDRAKVEAKEKVLLRGLLLDLFSGDVEFEYLDDSLHTSLLAKRDSLIAVDLNDPENVLTVIGDTCTFTYAKATRESYYFGLDDPIPGVKLRAIQCIGGPADLQKKDYRSFRQHIHTLAYDKNGKWLWQLCSDAPYSPREVSWKYNFVVSRDPGDYPDGDGVYGLARPVLIPFTITRSGALSYDVSCLDGMQLYYRT
jgi:hypothetical protein